MKKCPYCFEEIQDEAIKCKHCGSMLTGAATPPPLPPRLFRRSSSNKMIFGVCGGLAAYLDADPTLVRVVVALASLLSVGTGVVIYLLLALLVPSDNRP